MRGDDVSPQHHYTEFTGHTSNALGRGVVRSGGIHGKARATTAEKSYDIATACYNDVLVERILLLGLGSRHSEMFTLVRHFDCCSGFYWDLDS